MKTINTIKLLAVLGLTAVMFASCEKENIRPQTTIEDNAQIEIVKPTIATKQLDF